MTHGAFRSVVRRHNSRDPNERPETIECLNHPVARSPAHAVPTAHAIDEGLRSAHAASIIHRDIKQSNVLVDDTGRVVLADCAPCGPCAGRTRAAPIALALRAGSTKIRR